MSTTHKWMACGGLFALALSANSLLPRAAQAGESSGVRPSDYYSYQTNTFASAPGREVMSRDVNMRNPYHLPESYNYDWPYGYGLSH